MNNIWIFVGAQAQFPSGVFSTRELADAWITQNRLSGTLTAYPIDVGVFDWAVARGDFTPRRDDQRTPEFMEQFSSATQEHYHYQAGVQTG